MNNEYQTISSEIKDLEALISSVPPGNVIDKMSLESRLRRANSILSNLSQQYTATRAQLTFRGRPVFGIHGISADFASKAAGAFSDAFSAVAAGLCDRLRHSGPIPDKDKNQLLITGIAVGSFGFEFELPDKEQNKFPEFEETRVAMNKIGALFRLAAEGSDDDVAELVEEVQPRAVKKIHEFLDVLVRYHAWCGLSYENTSFCYTDYEQLKFSAARLKDENIQETQSSYRGEFQGVLPNGRTFEFKLLDQDGLISGKVDVSIEDPDVLNRDWLHKPVTAKLNVMQIGEGHPRYTLMSMNDLIQ